MGLDATSPIDLTQYDGKIVFVELTSGDEVAGPAQLVGDRLDVFGRLVGAADVVTIDVL
jgi:hypothetical protein